MESTHIIRALVALGSNLNHPSGGPEATLNAAVASLTRSLRNGIFLSAFYQTPAFPVGSGPDFVNAALRLDWAGDAQSLLDLLHEIEAEFGRDRQVRWSPRTLDLDLLAFGDSVLPDQDTHAYWRGIDQDTARTTAPPELIVPHPRLSERAFVLVPLADIAPDWRHPVTGKTVSDMLAELPAEDIAAIKPL